MNQRKKMPANGTICRASWTAQRRSWSMVASAASPGMEIRISTIAAPSSRAKATPAIPAARGVFSRSVVGSMNPSLSPPGPASDSRRRVTTGGRPTG